MTAKKKHVPKGKEILYAYISKKNREYLKSLEKETNQTTSYVVDQLITAIRTNSDVELQEYVPKYVQKAREFGKGK